MKMIAIAALSLVTGIAQAQSAAQSGSASDAGAFAQTGAITFEAAEQRTRLHTTAPVYVPPAMFGGSNNCGQSNTAGVSVTGFGIGGAVASESDACNAREDTAVAYRLGYQDVAALRFFCFGEALNRRAYEAAGHECPDEPRRTSAAYQGDDPIIRRRLGLE